jgi:hypothetical protein
MNPDPLEDRMNPDPLEGRMNSDLLEGRMNPDLLEDKTNPDPLQIVSPDSWPSASTLAVEQNIPLGPDMWTLHFLRRF